MAATRFWTYQDMHFPFSATRETLEALPDFQIRDDDIVVVSYPKAGSNWLMVIICKLLRAAGRTEEPVDTLLSGPMELTLKMAEQPGYVTLAARSSPRIFKTHLPIRFAPRGVSKPQNKVKVLVMMRNPKDSAVSYYHFSNKLCPLLGLGEPPAWEEFARAFVGGQIQYGDFCDHVLGWWQMRDDLHFLFLKYEDMKKDLPGSVQTIATFLDITLDGAAIAAIAEESTFDRMKQDFSRSQWPTKRIIPRKGIAGDWKNMLSPDESKAFDSWCERKLCGTGLNFEFE
ncbi:sulfotransferase family cytosolic 1B member 1-like isoform X3 [Branchiostoma floridae]|uniref:Sulfotransferase n=1 Tax=Branchiostoma floridae TaxID=7739 RepID=A0A9J7LKU1_BRAFL|nr:sulfotransferase family cytosolic 1B member 1-like isoform X3 [Branchiostoma floridae]